MKMFAATPGPRAGAGVLGSAVPSAPFFGADLVDSLGIPTFYETFDADAGEIIDPDLGNRFEKILGHWQDSGSLVPTRVAPQRWPLLVLTSPRRLLIRVRRG